MLSGWLVTNQRSSRSMIRYLKASPRLASTRQNQNTATAATTIPMAAAVGSRPNHLLQRAHQPSRAPNQPRPAPIAASISGAQPTPPVCGPRPHTHGEAETCRIGFGP